MTNTGRKVEGSLSARAMQAYRSLEEVERASRGSCSHRIDSAATELFIDSTSRRRRTPDHHWSIYAI